MKNAIWVATLSDGTTQTEHTEEWQIVPGERLPWIRLCNKLRAEGKYITSLRLNVDGKTIHLPRLKNNKFQSRIPLYYSVCYRIELDDVLGIRQERHYIDVTAHFEEFAVHYINETTDTNNSWVIVTDNELGIDELTYSPKPGIYLKNT